MKSSLSSILAFHSVFSGYSRAPESRNFNNYSVMTSRLSQRVTRLVENFSARGSSSVVFMDLAVNIGHLNRKKAFNNTTTISIIASRAYFDEKSFPT